VSLRTLQRYAASGNAPRAVYLTLWFESRWGLATLHAQAFNEARHARAWVASLERECERLRGVIRAYENAKGQPAANSALFNAARPDGASSIGRRGSGRSAGRCGCRGRWPATIILSGALTHRICYPR
jgi:hypothetical protein